MSQSALSQHLTVLREQKIVAFSRESRTTLRYRIADPRMEALIATLQGVLCRPGDEQSISTPHSTGTEELGHESVLVLLRPRWRTAHRAVGGPSASRKWPHRRHQRHGFSVRPAACAARERHRRGRRVAVARFAHPLEQAVEGGRDRPNLRNRCACQDWMQVSCLAVPQAFGELVERPPPRPTPNQMRAPRAGTIRAIGRSRPVIASRTSRARTSRSSPTRTWIPNAAFSTANTRLVSLSISRAEKPSR